MTGELLVVRRFSSEYLRDTRRGMWNDRTALGPLELSDRDRILDVGSGTGGLTDILREESPAPVTALDADGALLDRIDAENRIQGDARGLPFRDGGFDLVTCQALLINLIAPTTALTEFARVSSDLVAAIEPDNGDVTIESTVTGEDELARRARTAFIDGIGTDVAMGAGASEHFVDAGLSNVSSHEYEHSVTVKPPYDDASLKGAARKASGHRLLDHRDTMLNGSLSVAEFDELRGAWRSMGREVSRQMQAGTYERKETVPIYVTVGRVT